jgi:hypothetical protein
MCTQSGKCTGRNKLKEKINNDDIRLDQMAHETMDNCIVDDCESL